MKPGPLASGCPTAGPGWLCPWGAEASVESHCLRAIGMSGPCLIATQNPHGFTYSSARWRAAWTAQIAHAPSVLPQTSWDTSSLGPGRVWAASGPRPEGPWGLADTGLWSQGAHRVTVVWGHRDSCTNACTYSAWVRGNTYTVEVQKERAVCTRVHVCAGQAGRPVPGPPACRGGRWQQDGPVSWQHAEAPPCDCGLPSPPTPTLAVPVPGICQSLPAVGFRQSFQDSRPGRCPAGKPSC